ncbi:MAG: AEC family transporter [Parasporobacterium sp.]|nr:AEC family transporter [Parasporobacterium sp.]
MELMGILFRQIAIMFILMFIGMILFKTGKISKEGSKSLGNALIYIVMPAVVIKAFMVNFTTERLIGLGISFAAALAALLLSIAVSALCFRKHDIENFGTAFSNAGFMGIPIISVVLGSDAVFYVSSFVALLNILQWTYGVFIITRDKRQISLKKIVTNPVVLSLVIGIILFIIPVEMPEIVTGTIGYVAAMNAPVAMLSLGTYLAQIRFRELFTDRTAYISTLVRLVVIPLFTIALLSLLPAEYMTIRMAILIAASAPVGSNVAIFAQLHNKNYTQAVKSVCLSTICCIITMPLIVSLAGTLWNTGV